MQTKYLQLCILGTILPNIFVIKESLASGNILLYTYPIETIKSMFVNNITSAFMLDLLFVLLLFLIWSYQESRKYRIKHLGWVWLYTFAFGIAGGLPLFLLIRAKHRSDL